MTDLQIAGKIIATTTGEEHNQALNAAFKEFTWEQIKSAVEEYQAQNEK